MMPSTSAEPAVAWELVCRRHLRGQLARLRLLLHRRALWLRHQWQAEEKAEIKAFAITDAHADRLLRGSDDLAMAEFYARNPEAQRVGGVLRELERELCAESQALRDRAAALPLDSLTDIFHLSRFEREVVLLCLAPELDSSFERLYGYLQDDATRRYVTPELALALFGGNEEEEAAAWRSFEPRAPLRSLCLLPSDGSALASLPLRLCERITTYLQGSNRPAEDALLLLRPIESIPLPDHQREQAAVLARWARERMGRGSCPRLNLVGPPGAGKQAVARALCGQAGLGLFSLEVQQLARGGPELFRLLEREALLLQFAVYVETTAADPGADAAAGRLVDELIGRLRVFLLIGSRQPWHTEWPLLSVPVGRATTAEQSGLWRMAFADAQIDPQSVNLLVEQFDFGPAMISRAVAEAREHAGLRATGDGLTFEDLWRACRDRTGRDMHTLAQRIEPAHTWEDIVVTPATSSQLQEIAAQVANRYRVYEEWGFGRKLTRGRGISALFAGPSGTGKTLAAEILAGQLQLELFRIDLSSVVSKYIGETEKNLRRVFDAAEGSGAILFFDEADALFGKRSEVKDSHDRYANIEINYLLQRMEEYRGVAILATNMKSHLDQAFLRRLRFVVEFRFPTGELRRRIWQKSFPPGTPLDGLAYDLLARLEISGGNIRNIAVNAAFAAARDGMPVTMIHVMRAAAREYEKEERIVCAGEFGSYFEDLQR